MQKQTPCSDAMTHVETKARMSCQVLRGKLDQELEEALGGVSHNRAQRRRAEAWNFQGLLRDNLRNVFDQP